MRMPPLITSIPPRLSRLVSGEEIGPSYQRNCVESWKRAGFEPISVNSTAEDQIEGTRTVAVSRDAFALTARPLVYFADLLAVASAEACGGPFALVNADILFPPGSDLVAETMGLQPGQAILGRRADIAQLGQATGTVYPHGYDFFAARG